jgi:hypothetical protein
MESYQSHKFVFINMASKTHQALFSLEIRLILLDT